jgi:hypothetical protein
MFHFQGQKGLTTTTLLNTYKDNFPPSFFFLVSPSCFYEHHEREIKAFSVVSFIWFLERIKELKVWSIMPFSWLYEREKELKVLSFGENKWVHGMKLHFKCVEQTYENLMQE